MSKTLSLPAAAAARRSAPTSHPSAIAALRRQVATLIRERLAPLPQLTVSEWADEFRQLAKGTTAMPGTWSTSLVPYLREPMDTCCDLHTRQTVFMKSSQVAATEMLINIIFYHAHQDPTSILLVLPSDKLAEKFSKNRLAPNIRATSAVRDRISAPRSRDSDNTLLSKAFPGGHLTIAGANAPSGLSSWPIRIVLCDEVDRYPASAGTEGDPVALAFFRAQTYWNKKLVMVSTPTVKDHSRIEAAYEASDQRRFYVPCPHCDHFQTLRWRDNPDTPRLIWDKTDEGKPLPQTAAYACESCGALINESAKPHMLARGEWRARYPDREIAGFHLNALYSPWVRWAEIVSEFLEVRRFPDRLKTWVNQSLGETFEEQGERADPDALISRREAYPAEVPAGVAVLTAGVDVQEDRLELAVYGWGAGQENWLIRHERLYGDPAVSEVWQRLEALLVKPYEHESGRSLRIYCTAIDSGHLADQVYKFVRPRRRRRVYAVKGRAGEADRAIVGPPSKIAHAKVKLFTVAVDKCKDVLFARLKIDDPGPGYLHFPQQQPMGVDAEFFKQFSTEKIVTRIVGGVLVRRYLRDGKKPNEAIDLWVYGYAALQILGPNIFDRLDYWAKVINGKVPAPATAPQRRAVYPGIRDEFISS